MSVNKEDRQDNKEFIKDLLKRFNKLSDNIKQDDINNNDSNKDNIFQEKSKSFLTNIKQDDIKDINKQFAHNKDKQPFIELSMFEQSIEQQLPLQQHRTKPHIKFVEPKRRIIAPKTFMGKELSTGLERTNDYKRKLKQFTFLIVFISFVIILISLLIATLAKLYTKRRLQNIRNLEENIKQYEMLTDDIIKQRQQQLQQHHNQHIIQQHPIQQINYNNMLQNDINKTFDKFNISKHIYNYSKDKDGICRVKEVSITQTDKDQSPKVNVYTKVFKDSQTIDKQPLIIGIIGDTEQNKLSEHISHDNIKNTVEQKDINDIDKEQTDSSKNIVNEDKYIKTIEELNERIKNIEEQIKTIKPTQDSKQTDNKQINPSKDKQNDKNKSLIDVEEDI